MGIAACSAATSLLVEADCDHFLPHTFLISFSSLPSMDQATRSSLVRFIKQDSSFSLSLSIRSAVSCLFYSSINSDVASPSHQPTGPLLILSINRPRRELLFIH